MYGYQDIFAEFVEETIFADIVDETIEATIVEETILADIVDETLLLEIMETEELQVDLSAEEIIVEVESWSSSVTSSKNDFIEYVIEAGENLICGQPVFLSMSGKLMKALADNSIMSIVYGFVSLDTNISQLCNIIPDGFMTMTNWTNITGEIELSIGSKYYLSSNTSGMLTIIPPTIVGQYIAPVGKAISATKLDIEIQPTILL